MYRQQLLDNLRTAFDDSELRDLCFELHVDYEELSGQNKRDKARELLVYFERRQRLDELITAGSQMRPHLDWSTTEPTAAAPVPENTPSSERDHLTQAIAALGAQRPVLGDAVVETALAPLREKLAALDTAATPPTRQRKYLTILFADVSGFTAMSETRDAEEVSDVMNQVWQWLDKAIVEQDGWIDKHMGDAVMALFGTPVAHEDDPERAVLAALKMQAQLAQFRQEKQINLGMRIGVNTGPVLLDIVGTREEFTAMGDTVNVASRLEHAAPVGGILISHETYQHVRGLFDVQTQQPLSVKGKSQPIQTYIVERARPHMFRAGRRGIDGLAAPMIGRDAELSRLQDAFYMCVDERRMQMFTLTGEAGIGKSRLLQELNQWLEREAADAWLLQGRATPQMEQTPFSLLRHLLLSKFDIYDSDDASTAQEKLAQGITAELGVLGLEKAHFIGRLLGFEYAGSPYLAGVQTDARQMRDRAFTYLGDLLQAIGRKRPVILFLEDVHWADEASLDWITHLANRGEQWSIFLVVLARPHLFDKRPSWGEGLLFHQHLNLQPLSRWQNRQLVEQLLARVNNLPDDLRDLIVTRSEGNPYYVEELIKMFLADGVILPHETEWQVDLAQLTNLRIPGTLHGILQARIDLLARPQRETLGQAAVVGRVFWDEAISYLQDTDKTDAIIDILDGLRQQAMVMGRGRSTFGPAQEYIFKHALLRDAAYEGVLRRLRRHYHAEVAEWIFAKTGDRIGEYAGVMAQHYEAANMNAEAAYWYGRSAQQAQASYAPAMAIDHYQKALALHNASPERPNWLEGLGKMLDVRARFDEAVAVFAELVTAVTDPPQQAHAWNLMSATQERQGDFAGSMHSATSAATLVREIGADDELVQALIGQAFYALRLHQLAAAQQYGEEAQRLSQQIGDARQTMEVLIFMGELYKELAQFDQATACQSQAVTLAMALGDKRKLAALLNNQGALAMDAADWATAVRHFADAMLLNQEIGNRYGEMVVLLNLSDIYLHTGDYSQAEDHLRQLLAMPEAAGAPFLALAQTHLADALFQQQRVAEAVGAGITAVTTAQAQPIPRLTGRAWLVLGQILAQHPDGAMRQDLPLTGVETAVLAETNLASLCFAQSVHVYARAHMYSRQAAALQTWAAFEETEGNTTRAQSLYEQAKKIGQTV